MRLCFSAIIMFFGSLLVFTVCTIYKPPFFQTSEAARQSCKTYWLVGFHLEYFIFDSDAKKSSPSRTRIFIIQKTWNQAWHLSASLPDIHRPCSVYSREQASTKAREPAQPPTALVVQDISRSLSGACRWSQKRKLFPRAPGEVCPIQLEKRNHFEPNKTKRLVEWTNHSNPENIRCNARLGKRINLSAKDGKGQEHTS